MTVSRDTHVSILSHAPWESSGGTAFAVRELSSWAVDEGYPVEILAPASTSIFGSGESDVPAAHRPTRLGRLPGEASGPSWKRLATVGRSAAVCAFAERVRRGGVRRAWWVHGVDAALAFTLAPRRGELPWIFHRHQLMATELPCYFASRALKSAAGLLGALLDVVAERAPVQLSIDASLPGTVIPGVVRRTTLAGLEALRAKPAANAPVVYAGNADSYQNLDSLFRACAMLGKPLSLVTSRKEAFAALCGQECAPQVRFVEGGRERQLAALARGGVLVIPREDRNGFPMKALNGLALGLPLVVSEAQSRLRELPGVYRVPLHGDKHQQAQTRAWSEAIAAALAGPKRFTRDLDGFTIDACGDLLHRALESVAFPT